MQTLLQYIVRNVMLAFGLVVLLSDFNKENTYLLPTVAKSIIIQQPWWKNTVTHGRLKYYCGFVEPRDIHPLTDVVFVSVKARLNAPTCIRLTMLKLYLSTVFSCAS